MAYFVTCLHNLTSCTNKRLTGASDVVYSCCFFYNWILIILALVKNESLISGDCDNV